MIYISAILGYNGLYLGIGGLILGVTTFLLCRILHNFQWSPKTAGLTSGVLTLMAVLASALALGGTGAWIWSLG